MDIKLKNSKVFKIVNIIILIIMITVIPIQLGKTIKSNNVEENIYNRVKVTNYLYYFNKEILNFSDWYINLDGEINEESVERELNNIKLQQEKEFNSRKDYIQNSENKESLIEELKKEIIKPDDELRETIIRSRKEHFEESKNEIFEENKNIQFYVKNIQNGSVITNVPGSDVDYFSKENSFGYETFSIMKDKVRYSNEYTPNMVHIVAQIESSNLSSDSLYERYYKIPNNLEARDFLYEAKMQEEILKSELIKNIVISFLVIIIFGISSIIVYKNRRGFNAETFARYNRVIPIEIKIISPVLVVVNIVNMYLNNAEYSRGLGEFLIIFQPILLIISFTLVNELTNTKIAEIDYENVKKRSIFYSLKILTIKLVNLIKGSFLVKSKKIIVITAMVMTILFYVSLFFWNRGVAAALPYKIFVTIFPYIYPIIIMIYILNISNGLKLLKIDSDKIVEGNYNVEIKVKGPKIVKDIAANIKNIKDGFSKAVNDAVKSEKLKGELITNVSHDLKTPLTSIISYVDLLKNENLKEEDKIKYINVLDGKTQRLKVLIEDLFEASKAASGSIELQKENIDVSSLLRQTLGEYQEKISSSSLEFINKWPDEKAEVYLDGKKTWRIFENLISNILKYSMENSRVYIEVIKNEDNVQIVMKNISAYQLDFTEDEVVERFKRGDKSRHTEGSGLGLSIAKSLTNLQDGTLKIDIDGDLFKVILTFKAN